jgi:hypothetical protein
MGLFDDAFPDAGNGGILPYAYGVPDRPPGLPDWLWQNPQSLSALPLLNAGPPALSDRPWRNPPSLSAMPTANAVLSSLPDLLNPQPLREMPVPITGPSGLPDWLWQDPQRMRFPGFPDWLPRNPQSPSDMPMPHANGAELSFADRWGPVQRAREPGSAPSGVAAFGTPSEWLAPYVGAEGQPAMLGPHVSQKAPWAAPPGRNIWGNVPYVGAQGQPTDVGEAFTHEPKVQISPEMNGRLSRIGTAFKQATGKTLNVWSGTRSAAGQARAMYDNFKKRRNKETYKNEAAFNEIRQAYDNGMEAGHNPDQIISDMSRVIQSQINQGIFISRHMLERGADINPDMNERDKRILEQIVRDQERGSMLDADNHLHLQF